LIGEHVSSLQVHQLALIINNSITNDPENLAAINALAGMGILTDDDSLVDAALSEILSLPLERRHILDPRRDVNYLLIQHHLGQVRLFFSPNHVIVDFSSQ
jgi:superkiller protein 3